MDNNIKVLQGQIDSLNMAIKQIEIKRDSWQAIIQTSPKGSRNSMSRVKSKLNGYNDSIFTLRGMVNELTIHLDNLNQCKLAH